MQLASKMRFLAAQMIALLEGDLWQRNARHANAMAKLLEKKLKAELPDFNILYPVEANALFVEMPSNILQTLQKKYFFWIWNAEQTVGRFMTSWDTKEEFVEEFVSYLKKIL